MTFILNEDAAMKSHLAGIVVVDEKNNSRPVGVWFSHPDLEVRAQAYPYLTVKLVSVVMDRERAIHGLDTVGYIPDGYTGWPASGSTNTVITESPIPVQLGYQITSFARHPRHNSGIIAAMIGTKFPFQFGGIEVVPDNTVRRAVLRGYIDLDTTDSDNKRLYSKSFDVYVESELLTSKLYSVTQALTVSTTLDTAINSSVIVP